MDGGPTLNQHRFNVLCLLGNPCVNVAALSELTCVNVENIDPGAGYSVDVNIDPGAGYSVVDAPREREILLAHYIMYSLQCRLSPVIKRYLKYVWRDDPST